MSFPLSQPEFLHIPDTVYDRSIMSARTRLQPHFFQLRSERLDDIVCRPYNLFLEIGARKLLDLSLSQIVGESPDFALSLTTSTAYRHDPARAIASHINQRFGMQGHKMVQLQTCLQEALANAIIHGNLGIQKKFGSLADFGEHCALIEERLAEPQRRERRITILAWDNDTRLKLAVTDQGEGFHIAKPSANAPQNESPHGRGIVLIRSLADRAWADPAQRTLFMAFMY